LIQIEHPIIGGMLSQVHTVCICHSNPYQMHVGSASGICVAMVATPVELVKSRLQIQYDDGTRLYRGPIDCVRTVVAEGGIPALWRGLGACMVFRGLSLCFGAAMLSIHGNCKQCKLGIQVWSVWSVDDGQGRNGVRHRWLHFLPAVWLPIHSG
jgi:hypothetical protein